LGRVLPTSPPLSTRPYSQIRLKCPYLKGPQFYLSYSAQVAAWLGARAFDVVTSCDADTLLGCTIGVSLNGAKLVFDAHEYFSELPEVVGRWHVKELWTWVEELCIPRAKQAYTVGPALARVFSERYCKPFGVVRNVPLKANYAGLLRRPMTGSIVYTGAVNEGRGVEELLEALVLLPQYSAVICGDGPLLETMKRLAQSLGVAARVRFTGRLSPDELRSELARAWIAFSALKPQGESYRLSLTNKFFDYIQAGLPQLCPALPEYEAIVSVHPVGLAIPCTPKAIIEGLRALSNQHVYDIAASACAQAAKVFNWELEQQELTRLYRPLQR
jgi:glycosyltransferase involved in cell wall biosynthesis